MINMTLEEIKTIFENYMHMDYCEIDKYINSIAYQKSCNIETIKKRLEKYAKTLGKQKYEEYVIRKNEIKKQKYIYISVVGNLLKELSDGKKIDYQNYTNLNMMIERYRKVYPEKSKELDDLLKDKQKYYDKINNYYLKEVFILDSKPEQFNYVNEIKDILNCKTEGQAITYMRNLQFTQNHFDKLLSKFKNKYVNYKEYEEKLIYLFEKYKKFVNLDKQENKQIKEMLDIKKEEYDYSLQIISDLINSNYSIYEYCHHHLNINLNDLEKCINIVCCNEKDNIQKLKEKLNKKNNHFILELKEIVNRIEVKENYDFFDYYMDTKLSLKDFNTLTKKYNLSTPVLRSFLNSNKKYFSGYTSFKLNKEIELKCNRIIKGRLITEDEKIKVLAYLEANQMPIDMVIYKSALNRYINGTIDVSEKKYIKK